MNPPRATTSAVGRPGADVRPSGGRLRQPHERDESADDAARIDGLAPSQRDQMARARRDAEGGGRNTDCRAVPQAEDSPCARPADPSIPDDVLAPDDPHARNAENRLAAQHDPGPPAASAPDGSAHR
jgi:hypothetical protein